MLVVGACDAIGSAIMRRFAGAGFVACGARRNADKLGPVVASIREGGGRAHGFAVDARREEQVVALFYKVEGEIGPLEAVVFNVGANVPMTMLETSSQKFFKIWEMACFGGFLTGREAARRMQQRGRGTILFTGATASLRGAAGFGAFASAKHGLRAVAQSLARELGPKNIHVAHCVIDTPVDTQWVRTNVPGIETRPPDGITRPESIADYYLFLHRQPRDAWTFELDLRPWSETW